MMIGWNKILGISVPLLVAILALLASMVPVILQLKEKKHGEKEMSRISSKTELEYPQTDCTQSEFSIVGSIHSNNNSPYLAETLSRMLERTSELGIELNLNLRGCATIG